MRDRMSKRVALALLALALGAGPATALAQENDSSPPLSGAPESPAAETSLADIEDEVMCPICGTTLQLSQSPQADRERAFIQRLIAEGRSKEEIKDALVAEYGSEVLALPESEGFDLAAWLVPGIAILVAGGAIGVGLWRWRRRDRAAEPRPEPEVLDAAESERLSSDLARYDL
jgi:cytochrome c-type biogenesis protein CcmH